MASHTHNSNGAVARRVGFSLIELLTVIGIIALLIGILVPVAGFARKSASATRELSAARQLAIAWTAYATDHRGRLLPAYRDGFTARDEFGEPLGGPTAARYPWRLAPYFDYDFDGFYLDKGIREQLDYADGQTLEYFLSFYPSFGINSVFIGGDKDYPFEALYGDFYLTRLAQPKRPAELIVFASSRTNTPYPPYNASVTEGYHRVIAPNTTQANWEAAWDPDAPAKDWGHVSMRLGAGQAAIGFFDGHTDTLDEGEIRDMRHWADQADSYDWMLELE
jgi:type II secretory pathway pseudopilin PulG